jgi:hypothetical protein
MAEERAPDAFLRKKSGENGETPETPHPENLDLEPLENQQIDEAEADLASVGRQFTLEEINEVTWKVTDGRGTLAWDGYRSSYRTTRAVGWLMGVGGGMWICRYRNKASQPMRLAKAKTYLIEMIRGIRPGKVVTDPISDLHRLHLKFATEPTPAEPMPTLAEVVAIERANFPPLTRLKNNKETIRSGTDAGDDNQLEHHEDGYPKLPACLDRLRNLKGDELNDA